MSTEATINNLNEAQATFAEKVKGRLHGYVKESHHGRPAITCIWNETPENTCKEIVFLGEPGFDALTVVRAANKSMKASVHVLQMLIEMYESQHEKPVGVDLEF